MNVRESRTIWLSTKLLAGCAEVDITPPVGLPMDGYLARNGVSQGVHDPLLGQILLLDATPTRVALVTLDVMAVSAAFSNPLRRALAVELDTPPDSILICASHTHAGPSGLQTWFPIDVTPSLNLSITQEIQAKLVDAARRIVANLVPVRIAYGFGKIEGVGKDRNQSLPAPDPLVTAFRIDRLDGLPLAIVFHYACHPTILGPQLEYSADFPGAARRRIQERFPGATCLYLNGATANISTRFTRRNQSFDEAHRLGGLLGKHVIMLLERPTSCDIDLGVAQTTISLPVRSFSSANSHAFELSGNARIDQTRAEGAIIETQLAEAFRNRDHIQATLVALRIGPWRLFGVPGEAFNELAAELRHLSAFALVVGYVNDYLGYFPTQRAIDAETYESLSSPYDARALKGIRDALLNLI